MITLRKMAVLFSAIALAACASVPSGPECPAIPAGAELGSYNIAPGDRLEIIIFRQPDMSGEFVVDSDGMLSSPLLGRIEAAGMTTEQLAVEIRRGLIDGGYLADPAISTTLVQGGEVYVLGEINRPSAVPYKHRMKVVHAITNAGDITYRGSEVRIKRNGCWFDGDYETFLVPNDVIMVTERFF